MQYLGSFLPILLMIAMFYLIIFVPENKRKKKYSAMLTGLKVNDEIMSRGGIIGKIVNIQDNFVIMQTGPDKMRIKIDKNGISQVLNAEDVNETEKIESTEK
jgi:preprotein translocase subunit YajC